MASDWIKTRVDLYRDPKVSLMSDFLSSPDSKLCQFISRFTQRDSNVTRNVMRNATVGALVSVWGVSRTQGKRDGEDLLLAGVTLEVIDDMADIPGFGAAMAFVGWVKETGNGLVFPKFFEENNTDYDHQKKLNRERQARYRSRKSSEKAEGESNVTVTLHNAPREEKRRGENNTPLPPFGKTGGEEEKKPPTSPIHPPPENRVTGYFTPCHASQEHHEAAERVKDAYQREVRTSHPPAGAKNAILELISTGTATEAALLVAVKHFAQFAKKKYPDAKMRMSARTFFGKEKSAWADWIAGSPIEDAPVFDADAEYARIQERNRRILG